MNMPGKTFEKWFKRIKHPVWVHKLSQDEWKEYKEQMKKAYDRGRSFSYISGGDLTWTLW